MSLKKQILTQLKDIQDLIRDNIGTLNNLIEQSGNLSALIEENTSIDTDIKDKLIKIREQIDVDIKKSQNFISSLTDRYNTLIETLFTF